MVHGDADETAPVEDARRFAEQVGAKLTEIEGADHGFSNPDGMDRVIETAVRFFTAGYSRRRDFEKAPPRGRFLWANSARAIRVLPATAPG